MFELKFKSETEPDSDEEEQRLTKMKEVMKRFNNQVPFC
jgi:hypothetical protein